MGLELARVLGGRRRSALVVGFLAGLSLAWGGPSAAQDCLDATRTLIPGGPGNSGCRTYNNQAACNTSYIIGGSGPTSCYLQDDGDCEGCGPNNEGLECTNVCQPAPFCAPGRPTFVGGNGNSACQVFNGDSAQCNQAYHRSQNGEFTSCFNTSVCDACGDDESEFCLNSCVPPPTCVDMTRTNFIGGPGTRACRQFDGNETACNQAFHLGEDGVAPCYYDEDGDCQGCGINNERDGDCTNTCIPTPTCLDMTRTTYAGGPGSDGCDAYDDDQSACEQAFVRGDNGRVNSCFYDEDGDCRGCDPENEGDGHCTNTCTAPVPCLDMTRTIYTGPPGSEGCERFDDDQTSCEQAYVEGGAGVASCYYDTDEGRCRGCGPSNENNGNCTNTCATTPTCALDMTRTIYAGGPGSEGCREFDGDETQCLQAFVRGDGGVASCFFEPDGDCRGCGPENVNDGDCVNTCKNQPVCGSDPDRTVLGCGRFDGDPAGCATAYGLLDDGSPTSCVAVDLCLGCGPNNQEDGLCTNACQQQSTPVVAPAVSWPGLIAVALGLTALGFYRLRRRA